MDQAQGLFSDIRVAVEITRQAIEAPLDELTCPVERVQDLERIALQEMAQMIREVQEQLDRCAAAYAMPLDDRRCG